MASRAHKSEDRSEREAAVISRITVSGFKAIRDEQSVDVRPLTVLAGANSSGKSSIMQALLLLKQTLEATYDPGALRLDGPNVEFSEVRQLLSRTRQGKSVRSFRVAMRLGEDFEILTCFEATRRSGIGVSGTRLSAAGGQCVLARKMTSDSIRRQVMGLLRNDGEQTDDVLAATGTKDAAGMEVVPDRCFLRPQFLADEAGVSEKNSGVFTNDLRLRGIPFVALSYMALSAALRRVIHLPGLRGNPARTYPVSAVGDTFPGRFQDYVASVIAHWQENQNRATLKAITLDLKTLGLSWTVKAHRLTDAQVEIQVGRLVEPSRDSARDLVSIADVGLGVSQALPVLVALHAATPKHLVYIEQPELHLHPRAQVAMAEVLARAVKRGVRVVIETHSALLLLAIQALVAEGELPSDDVILHWFTRSKKDGATTITTAKLDEAGAYGDWPEDFGDVESKLDCRYLDAAESRMIKR